MNKPTNWFMFVQYIIDTNNGNIHLANWHAGFLIQFMLYSNLSRKKELKRIYVNVHYIENVFENNSHKVLCNVKTET